MKKTILFGVVGLLLALVVGFWVYSFLYGSPTNTTNGLFTNLGIFGNNTQTITPAPVIESTSTPTVDVKTDRLRQLTTKPVIGMRVITIGTSTIMRYVEAGTGQIFDIDMKTGSESRVSQISVPVASEAEISPDGKYIAIRSGYTSQNEVVLVTIDGSNTTSKILPNKINEFHFAPTGDLLFTEFNNGVTEGKQYDPVTGVVQRIFTVPFTALRMVWSNSTTTPHYVYTKPARGLIGYAYQIKSGSIKRLPFLGDELMLTSSSFHPELLVTRVENDTLQSYTYSATNSDLVRSTLTVIPEKCTSLARGWICGGGLFAYTEKNLFDWLRGSLSFDDRLWSIDLNKKTAEITYPKIVAGRSIDITYLAASQNGRMLYFINKIDQTLWVYE